MSETTAEIIERVGLIPVLRAKNPKQAHAVVEAMIAGGVTVVEVTMTCPDACGIVETAQGTLAFLISSVEADFGTPRIL